MLRSEHVSPKVGTSGGWDGRQDLGHAGADEECYRGSAGVEGNEDRVFHTEHADDDPANGHDSGPTRVEAIGKEA